MLKTRITLDAVAVKPLLQIADEQGKTLEQVINELARQHLRKTRRAKLERETEAFQAMHNRLKKKYPREHVAIHNGKLVDHDKNPAALVRRIRKRFGNAPVLVCEVEETPDREIMIRSPRLEQST